ncbi:MAG: type II toxin-antitoxin system HigB family toxin [Candidatus Kapaibacterium sp.]
MRIISKRTLKLFWEEHASSEQPLKSWFDEAAKADWSTPNELKLQFGNASIVSEKRVVFNIHGNTFRLVVDIEFRLKIIFIVWVGTHREYDKLNVREIHYVKTDSK